MKVQRIYIFLVVGLFLMFAKPSNAQQTRPAILPAPKIFFVFPPLLSVKKLPQIIEKTPPSTFFLSINWPSTTIISPDYYTRNFGFFCRKELQFEKATNLPLRFRLGSLDYVNRLEGK